MLQGEIGERRDVTKVNKQDGDTMELDQLKPTLPRLAINVLKAGNKAERSRNYDYECQRLANILRA
jgi:hypothetical protein